MITIDGLIFDIPVIVMDEDAAFLDKFAERTVDGKLHRELIGVFFNFQIQFGSSATTAELARLWLKLTEPIEFHTVTVPDTDGTTYTFTAYFSNVKRKLRRVSASKTFWKTLTVNFIAQAPARS